MKIKSKDIIQRKTVDDIIKEQQGVPITDKATSVENFNYGYDYTISCDKDETEIFEWLILTYRILQNAYAHITHTVFNRSSLNYNNVFMRGIEKQLKRIADKMEERNIKEGDHLQMDGEKDTVVDYIIHHPGGVRYHCHEHKQEDEATSKD